MYGKDHWYGKEVEGRLSDIETVFIRKGVLPNDYSNYPHIYFTIEYIEDCVKGTNTWNVIHELLSTKQMITIEANQQVFNSIPMSIFNRVHIIYRIADPNVEKLKKTDTLSIDAGWYRCSQITKENMLITTPDSYKFDYQ